jgi:L-alanine-DL-glutamate epimerase-like enolase superfamily enzyme
MMSPGSLRPPEDTFVNSPITRIEMATLVGTRPRPAGSNARLGPHGPTVRLPIVRLTTADGAAGFGRCTATEHQLRTLLGTAPAAIVGPQGVSPGWLPFEYPLLDLAARLAGKPVWQLVAPNATAQIVTSYDTSLYFDDLNLDDDDAAVALIAGEARFGWERGHRACKIKVGRGARHMPLEAGMVRDIAIIRAVREAMGPDARIAIDANDGWNLNLTKRVLEETADVGLYWLEEAFHEDGVLYEDLQAWQAANGLSVLVADGEGAAHPALLEWAEAGHVDVVQYDIYSYGFGRWLTLSSQLAPNGTLSAPHSYGNGIGHYVISHLARVTPTMPMVEWDEAAFDAIDASGWEIRDGVVEMPDAPGWGLELDEAAFTAAVRETGFTLQAS